MPSTEKWAETLAESVSQTHIAKVIKSSATEEQIQLRIRVSNNSKWLQLLTMLLKEEQRLKTWSTHACRQYFLDGGRLVYIWCLFIQSKDLEGAANSICMLLSLVASNLNGFLDERGVVKSPAAKVAPGPDVLNRTFPLIGANLRDRTQTDPKKRGAFFVGGQ